MNFLPKGRFQLWVLSVGCGVIATAGAMALSPALAGKADVVGRMVAGTITCNNTTQCLERINQGSGAAIAGSSVGGNGIVAQTTAFTTSGSFSGIVGTDAATPNPSGTPFNNAGVFGKSSTGIGVRASSATGTGIVASANGGSGIFATTQSNITGESSSGVFGEDVGNSSLAAGVTGFSGTGIAVQGDQFERGKYLNAAFLGLTFASSITTYFPAKPPGGVFNSDIGEGVVAETSGATSEALAAANFGGGPVMRGYAAHVEVMDIDNGGNMILKGKLTQHGSPNSVTHTAHSGDVVMYSPMQAVATVEDVGEAQLNAGETYVRIDQRFADTMNRNGPYLVFLTPQGDTAGLYVTQKTAAGFVVREHGGRSNVVFDYRIVAQPLEAQGARLASAPQMPAQGFTRSMTTHKPTVSPLGTIKH
jgi:hypothetical protein